MPGPPVEGATFYFSEGLCSLGRGGAKGRGQGLEVHGSGCCPPPSSPGGGPLLYAEGAEINGSLRTLRPVFLLIQPDGLYLPDCCTVFVAADANHLHTHQFLR